MDYRSRLRLPKGSVQVFLPLIRNDELRYELLTFPVGGRETIKKKTMKEWFFIMNSLDNKKHDLIVEIALFA